MALQVSTALILSVGHARGSCQFQCRGDKCLQTPQPPVPTHGPGLRQTPQRLSGALSCVFEGQRPSTHHCLASSLDKKSLERTSHQIYTN